MIVDNAYIGHCDHDLHGEHEYYIPDHLKKYCSLLIDGTIIYRFKCPASGCTFSTRLGPGAIRMHVLIKADPLNETRYSLEHEEFYRKHESELSVDNVRILANIQYRPISYRKECARVPLFFSQTF